MYAARTDCATSSLLNSGDHFPSVSWHCNGRNLLRRWCRNNGLLRLTAKYAAKLNCFFLYISEFLYRCGNWQLKQLRQNWIFCFFYFYHEYLKPEKANVWGMLIITMARLNSGSFVNTFSIQWRISTETLRDFWETVIQIEIVVTFYSLLQHKTFLCSNFKNRFSRN